jgi:hypothetical protein
LEKKISRIYDNESRARACRDFEQAKLLKKKLEALEEESLLDK